MPKKTHAGEAGLNTSVQPLLDPFGGFKRDDYRLKAVESRHAAQKEIARTRAWEGLGRLAVLALLIAGVVISAMVLGKPVPLELALSLLLGKAPPQ